MQRIKMMLVAVVALFAIGAVGSSAAQAGTVNLHVSGTVLGVPVANCDATATYTGGPPPTSLTIDASSFAGTGSTPCDETSLTVNDDIDADFYDTYKADVSTISVTDLGSGCTFTKTGPTTLTASNVNGPYTGGGSASGSGGFLCLAGANLTISASF